MVASTHRFDLPSEPKKKIIKVIGVGGGGSNTVKTLHHQGIEEVNLVACNTDEQALKSNPVQHKLQIGINLTSGLGAGANPEVGKNAAIESKEEIEALLNDGTKMLFVTAGMGGGTGTGAAPVIASIANKLGILTVGVVTLPFSFEGKRKLLQAQQGLKELRQHCDIVLVILNDRLREVLGNLSIGNAFLQADSVLATAVKSIAEIITVPGYVNVDFEDVKTVMRKAGAAVMGSAQAEGEGRARKAAEMALTSPLLDYKDIRGAKKILLSIVSGLEAEMDMDELAIITDYIQEKVGEDAEMIFGHGSDKQLKEAIRVTVIATGFEEKEAPEDKLVAQTSLPKNDSKNTIQPTESVPNNPLDKFATLKQQPTKSKKFLQSKAMLGMPPLPLTLKDATAFDYDKPQPYPSNRQVIAFTEERLKEYIEIPAYLRREVTLDPLPSQVDKKVTRYYLQEQTHKDKDLEAT